jgi:hypothetical protein
MMPRRGADRPNGPGSGGGMDRFAGPLPKMFRSIGHRDFANGTAGATSRPMGGFALCGKPVISSFASQVCRLALPAVT